MTQAAKNDDSSALLLFPAFKFTFPARTVVEKNGKKLQLFNNSLFYTVQSAYQVVRYSSRSKVTAIPVHCLLPVGRSSLCETVFYSIEFSKDHFLLHCLENMSKMSTVSTRRQSQHTALFLVTFLLLSLFQSSNAFKIGASCSSGSCSVRLMASPVGIFV